MPVRDAVVFPDTVAPITIARRRSVSAAQQALREQRAIGILLQRNPETEDPGPDDLHRVCTVANIVRYITAPDGTNHLICQGVQRARIVDFLPGTPFLAARILERADCNVFGDSGALPQPSAPGRRSDRTPAAGAAGVARCLPVADIAVDASGHGDILPRH